MSAQLADDGVRVAAASLTGVLPNQHGTDGGAKTSQFRKGLRRHLTIPAANRPHTDNSHERRHAQESRVHAASAGRGATSTTPEVIASQASAVPCSLPRTTRKQRHGQSLRQRGRGR